MLIQEAMGFSHCTDSVAAAFTGRDIHDSTTGAEEEVVLHKICSTQFFDALYLLHNTVWLCNDVQLTTACANKQNSTLCHHNTK